jgi:hypothetical protein
MDQSRAKRPNAQARMQRYEVPSEWRGLREMSVRWLFSRIGDPGSGEFADAALLRSFGVPGDLSAL